MSDHDRAELQEMHRDELREQLEAAQQEVGSLKAQLAAVERRCEELEKYKQSYLMSLGEEIESQIVAAPKAVGDDHGD